MRCLTLVLATSAVALIGNLMLLPLGADLELYGVLWMAPTALAVVVVTIGGTSVYVRPGLCVGVCAGACLALLYPALLAAIGPMVFLIPPSPCPGLLLFLLSPYLMLLICYFMTASEIGRQYASAKRGMDAEASAEARL